MEKSAAPIIAGEWCKGGMATPAPPSCCRTQEWQRDSNAGSTSRPPQNPACLHWGTCAPANISALLGCLAGSLGLPQDLAGDLRECLSNTIPPLTFVFHQEVLSSIEQICLNAKIHTCKHLFVFPELQLKRGQSWLWGKESFQDVWKAMVIYHLHCTLGKDGTIQQELWWNPPPLKIFHSDWDTNGRRKRSHLGKGKQNITSKFALCMGFTLWGKIFWFVLYFCYGWPVKQAHKYSMHMPVVPAAALIRKI